MISAPFLSPATTVPVPARARRTVTPLAATVLAASLAFLLSPAASAAEPPPIESLVFVSAVTDALGNPASALFRIRADGSGREQITPGGRYQTPSVSCLGRKLAFLSTVAAVHVCNWDGTQDVNIRPIGREHFQPRWSPDGREIVFASDLTSDAEVWVMNADGSNAANLTWSAASADLSPDWSPDGREIVFVSNRRGPYELFVLDRKSGESRCLTPGLGNCREPSWSPDGRWIAFASDRDGNWELYRIGPDGKNLQRLTENLAWDGQPAWDATGRRLAFISDRDGSADIFVLDVSTRALRNLTASPKETESSPAWVPLQKSEQAPVITAANVSALELPRPRMLFTAKELPALRERFATEPYAAAWKEFLARCDALLDPQSAAGKRLIETIDAIPAGFKWDAPWVANLYSLAFAYQVTGEEKYGRAAVPLFVKVCTLLAQAQRQPVLGLWSYSPGMAACTFDWLYPLLSDTDKSLVRTLFANSCATSLQGILKSPLGLGPGWEKQSGRSNFCVFMADDLGSPALALAGEPGFDPNWLAAAIKLLELISDRWFDDSGACAESASYFTWPVNSTMTFMQTVTRLGLTDCLRTGRIRNWPQWYAISSANGLATQVAIGDSYNGPPAVPLGFLDLYRDNPLVDLLWTTGKGATAPAADVGSLLWWRPVKADPGLVASLPRAALFPAPGYAVLRAGYAADDPMLVLAASVGRGHSHAESGALQLYGYGTSFILDTGYGDPWPTSHSQVLINGQGRPFPAAAPRDGAPSPFVTRVQGPFAAAVKVDATDFFRESATGHLDYTVPQPGYPVRRYVRYATMVASTGSTPPYFLVYDDCDRNGESNLYASQFIAERGRRIETNGSDALLLPLYTGSFFKPAERPPKGNGTITFGFTAKDAGKRQLWLFAKAEGRSWYRLFLDGKELPAGEFGFDSRQAQCWQWQPLGGRKSPLVVDLTAGEHSLVVRLPHYGHIPCATFARLLLAPAETEFEPFAPDAPEAPPGSLLLTAEQGVMAGDGWQRLDSDPQPERALFSFLRPEPPRWESGFHRMRMMHGAKDVNTFLRLRAEVNAVNPRFVTLLYPYRDGMETPRIERRERKGLIVTRLIWRDAVDTVLSAPDGKYRKEGNSGTDARLAVVRTPASGTTQWLILDGKRLTLDGHILVDSKGLTSTTSSSNP